MGIQDIPTNASLTFVHAKNINPASIKESYCIPSIQINQVGTIPFNAADSILEENNLYKVMLGVSQDTCADRCCDGSSREKNRFVNFLAATL